MSKFYYICWMNLIYETCANELREQGISQNKNIIIIDSGDDVNEGIKDTRTL